MPKMPKSSIATQAGNTCTEHGPQREGERDDT